jgi:hypothetical protein
MTAVRHRLHHPVARPMSEHSSPRDPLVTLATRTITQRTDFLARVKWNCVYLDERGGWDECKPFLKYIT